MLFQTKKFWYFLMQQLISNTTILVSKILNTSTSLEIMSPQAPINPTITLQSSKL